jgi:hypothetical protein
MGKPTGFMEYPRELPPDRPPLDRIRDWDEFHERLSDEKQQLQGARCMDCGIPFCHSGLIMQGAASGCPLHNLIPEWNDLIYRGLWREAWERLRKTNNFPEFTGRVCPAPARAPAPSASMIPRSRSKIMKSIWLTKPGRKALSLPPRRAGARARRSP